MKTLLNLQMLINMLDEIVEKTKERVEMAKSILPLEDIKKQVSLLEISEEFPFKKALGGDDISIIAEVKKASPSKGLIAEDFDYLAIAKEYEAAGASAISVLTEPYFFQGSDEYLEEIAKEVSIPVLRKDFVIDEYMIWEAKMLGASAVLLIVSILDVVQLKKYLDLAHDLGLSAIVETRRCVSGDVIFISESGIKTPEDVTRLKENDVDAVLIGETLMKSDDKKAMISELKNG